jgi:hypothetical protein
MFVCLFFCNYNCCKTLLFILQVISILDSLLVDESKPVTVPIAGDLVPEVSGHFVYSPSNAASARRGFVVLQNSDEQVESGNQCKLRFGSVKDRQ